MASTGPASDISAVWVLGILDKMGSVGESAEAKLFDHPSGGDKISCRQVAEEIRSASDAGRQLTQSWGIALRDLMEKFRGLKLSHERIEEVYVIAAVSFQFADGVPPIPRDVAVELLSAGHPQDLVTGMLDKLVAVGLIEVEPSTNNLYQTPLQSLFLQGSFQAR